MTDQIPNALVVQEDSTHSGLRSLILIAAHFGLTLSLKQMIRDHMLSGSEVSTPELVTCAQDVGLKATALTLRLSGLMQLGNALPVVLRLRGGGSMVLSEVGDEAGRAWVKLRDPMSATPIDMVVDRSQLDEMWGGEVILFKRDHEIEDKAKPFDIGMIVNLVFRERRTVRDVAICAVAMSILALAPIVFWREMIDRVLYHHSMNTFVVICTLMGILIAFDIIFAAIRRSLILHLTTRIDTQLSTYMFDKVLSLPVDYFERTQVGSIAHDMNEIGKIRNFLVGQMFGTVLDMFVLFVFLPVMAFYSPVLTIVVATFCVLIFTSIGLMVPTLRARSAVVIEAESARHSFMIQTLQGIRTVKSLALDNRQRKMWDVLVARGARARLAEGATSNLIQTVVAPLEKLLVSGTYALGVYLAIETNDPVYTGALFAFLLLSQRVAAPLVQAGQLINQLDEARAAVQIVGNLVNQAPEEGRTGHGVKNTLHGHLEFAKVRFSYKGSTSPALNDVTFEIAQGTTLGVMGRSGSGKTTITRLLQRLHSDYSGLIKLDGIDVREYDVDHLRGSLGVVLQENFLFTGSIRDNIMIGKPDATFDEVVVAARLGGAEEFIDKLPQGYDTHIYEGSPNLSGGQRQRIAIARALITNPRVLILDEATSALDAESEAIVNANIERIAAGRTMIIISHRLASLVRADAILVLDRGSVHDIGKHEELLDRCDIYASLWNQQNHSTPPRAPARPTLAYRGPGVAQ
ncbi:peptidase domain-containing ABC transporter [Lichenihabitans psoromatis]|uniref:peptidase domain-containing ABC transporter n=1 Tax=Lichenihabitans psoromatis TaxID=2528642 RepID=UPI001036C6D1|nr:peptidase domain-containing ABC transporter [Lichenihabitans psoromatis]